MHKLVKAEIYKLFKNKTFKVLCGIAIFSSIMMMIATMPAIQDAMMEAVGEVPIEESQSASEELEGQVVQAGQMGIQINDSMEYTAKDVFHLSFGSGVTEILIGVLIAALMASEYSQGTIKNTLAYGKKRHEFYIAKFLASMVGITIILSCLTLIGTIGTAIINGWGQPFEVSQVVGMVGTFIAAIAANSSVSALIMIVAITVKSNGATIGITAGIFVVVPSVVAFFYGTYTWFDKIYELTPFYNTALATSIYATNTDIIRSIVVALATIVIALMGGAQIFKAQDIK